MMMMTMTMTMMFVQMVVIRLIQLMNAMVFFVGQVVMMMTMMMAVTAVEMAVEAEDCVLLVTTLPVSFVQKKVNIVTDHLSHLTFVFLPERIRQLRQLGAIAISMYPKGVGIYQMTLP